MAAEDAELAETGELEDDREQQQNPHSQDRARRQDHGAITPAVWAPRGRRVSTWTMSIDLRSANGSRCTRW